MQRDIGPSRARLTLRCGCRDRVAAHVVYLATVCHPHIRHPELDSGSVEVVAEYFTDAESSSA
ncbi:MAG: hypothetical protein IIT57_05480 [Treponema sp.]|nr:hypothetical protein [Treponema sp.]